MQNVTLYRDPLAPDDPTAFVTDPSSASVWTNDQDVTWTLISAEYEFLTVVFDASWVAAGASQPVVNGNTAVVTGPGANAGPPVSYTYTMALKLKQLTGDRTVDFIRVGARRSGDIVIDPDVWNQPQP